MFRKFFMLVIVAVCAVTNANAETHLLERPTNRSAMQNECLNQHQNDHQSYVACIKEKKEAKRAERESQPMRGIDQMKENMNNPPNAK